jgi:RimJ/RimL family protein N-acetyltransferase
LWALETRDASRFIGDCGLTYQDVEGRDELEIGYHLCASERGNGFAVEAAAACLEYGFGMLGAERICSIVSPTNRASCGVAGKIHAHSHSFMKRDQPAIFFYTERADWTPTS